MKVRLYMMIQDRRFAPVEGGKRLIEGYDVEDIEFIDGGPKTDRVEVVVDGNDTAKLLPPKRGNVLWKFDLPHPTEINIESLAFNQVSVLATVLKTISMYEDSDVLGRPVCWRWETSEEPKTPLKIIPRHRQMEGAFYQRAPDKQWLEFNYFRSKMPPHEMVYTSLSRDVVAHETGHAILDGIAPHLMDAETRTPQSRALHESIGDITGLLIAISSGNLRKEVLASTRGSIENSSYFSAIGEEYGMAKEEGTGALRNLCDKESRKVITPAMLSDPNAHYALSEVLSAALYSVLIKMHQNRCKEYAKLSGKTEYSNSGKALWDSRQQFKRMTLGALDYLPPGEVTFVDYARAVIAADQASHPEDTAERQWFIEEFTKRAIADRSAFAATVPDVYFGDSDLESLVSNDELARAFAEKYRTLLGIPDEANFTVEPRLKACKKYYHQSECQDGQVESTTVRECVFKVWWKHGNRTNGTTLAIGWKTKRPRVLLTSNNSDRSYEDHVPHAGLTGPANRELAFGCCK